MLTPLLLSSIQYQQWPRIIPQPNVPAQTAQVPERCAMHTQDGGGSLVNEPPALQLSAPSLHGGGLLSLSSVPEPRQRTRQKGQWPTVTRAPVPESSVSCQDRERKGRLTVQGIYASFMQLSQLIENPTDTSLQQVGKKTCWQQTCWLAVSPGTGDNFHKL